MSELLLLLRQPLCALCEYNNEHITPHRGCALNVNEVDPEPKGQGNSPIILFSQSVSPSRPRLAPKVSRAAVYFVKSLLNQHSGHLDRCFIAPTHLRPMLSPSGAVVGLAKRHHQLATTTHRPGPNEKRKCCIIMLDERERQQWMCLSVHSSNEATCP